MNSVGAKGDSYDNALAESVNSLYKAELIRQERSWRTISDVELATARWVDWWNHRRLHSACGDIPPAEFEAAYAQGLEVYPAARFPSPRVSSGLRANELRGIPYPPRNQGEGTRRRSVPPLDEGGSWSPLRPNHATPSNREAGKRARRTGCAPRRWNRRRGLRRANVSGMREGHLTGPSLVLRGVPETHRAESQVRTSNLRLLRDDPCRPTASMVFRSVSQARREGA